MTRGSRKFQRSERRPAPAGARAAHGAPPRDLPAAADLTAQADFAASADLTAPTDLTALPDLAHGRSRAGPVRMERPQYVDLLPPCNEACPAGENIQAWLADVQAGGHERAWRTLVADNPLAAIHGW